MNEDMREAINEWIKEFDQYECDDTVLRDEMERLLEIERDDELYEKALTIRGMIIVIQHDLDYGDSAFAPGYWLTCDADEICDRIIWIHNYNKKNGGN